MENLTTFNVENQAQVNVNKVGIKEGIWPRWSCKFGLQELDAE
jgi:hypothetical protein